MSFAVPKGLPGNPNSKSLGRMAIETRVHNLWVRNIVRRFLAPEVTHIHHRTTL
jgi:hypothetical protein